VDDFVAGYLRLLGFDDPPEPSLDSLTGPSEFDHSHQSLSTAPDSPFVRKLTAQRRDATGFDKLVGRTLRRVEGTRVVEWELPDAAEWFAALADVFGLGLNDLDTDERDRLWERHASR
jgi:N-hydroxyarylamine O-acetyltransferase